MFLFVLRIKLFLLNERTRQTLHSPLSGKAWQSHVRKSESFRIKNMTLIWSIFLFSFLPYSPLSLSIDFSIQIFILKKMMFFYMEIITTWNRITETKKNASTRIHNAPKIPQYLTVMDFCRVNIDMEEYSIHSISFLR